MSTNHRAAEAMALEDFHKLREPQQRAVLTAHNDGWPRIRVDTRSDTRRALEVARIIEPGSRDFTPWGLFVYTTAKAAEARRQPSDAREATL
jgi:hypothetical protein